MINKIIKTMISCLFCEHDWCFYDHYIMTDKKDKKYLMKVCDICGKVKLFNEEKA